MNTLISVVVPVFNGEKYLSNIVNSMLSQTLGFENIELIFINNQSEDNSKEILSSFSKEYENIKVITLEKHYDSPGKSRNMGISYSSSDYLMFCDQDDEFKSDFCKVMYDEISSSHVDLVSSRYEVLLSDNKRYLNSSFLDSYDKKILINSIVEFPEIIYTQANLTIWNKIYNRKFLLNNEISFVETHWAEDYLFSIESFLKAKGIILLNNYAGYQYFINENSESHKTYEYSDFLCNCLLPLEKAKKLLVKNNFKYMPVLSEFLVMWINIFIRSDLTNDELKKLSINFNKWFKEYELTNRLVNLSIPFNILINIAIKIFSLNQYFIIIVNRIMNSFR